MTRDDLRTIAKQGLRDLKNEVVMTDSLSPMFRWIGADGRKHALDLPAGCEWLMNVGHAKEMLFDFCRQLTPVVDVKAWVFGSDVWYSRSTDEGAKHSREEHAQLMDSGFKKLQSLGWVVVEEALIVVAQTEHDVIQLQHVYVREPKLTWIGPPLEHAMSQADFGGRMKMWGADEDDITGGDVTRRGATDIGLNPEGRPNA